MPDVFISCSSGDRDVAVRLDQKLKSHGLTVFFDLEVLVAGENFTEAVLDAIRQAKVVLVLLSANTRRSRWVEQELITVIDPGHKRVISVLLDSEAKENWVWPLVAEGQVIDLMSRPDEDVIDAVMSEFPNLNHKSEEKMPDWQPSGTVETLEIESIDRKTLLIRTKENSTLADIVKGLNPSLCRIVLLIVGGADQPDAALQEKLKNLFSGVILPSAIEADALVLDGTPPATMQLIGNTVAFRRHAPMVVGVVPASCVTFPGSTDHGGGSVTPLNLDHSAFVLVPGDRWGAEFDARYAIARTLCPSLPVIVVVVNGSGDNLTEVLGCVRQEWQVLVVEGTGGLADQIAALKKTADTSSVQAEMAEIVRSGNVRVVAATDSVDTWRQLIEGRPKDDETLENVRNHYRRWDIAAVDYQSQFRKLQWTALALGIGATLVAILQPGWPPPLTPPATAPDWLDHSLHVTVILIPILTSILFAFMNHFRPGNRWLLLRGGAETIRREMFRYRTRTGIYSDEQRGLYRATRLGQEVDKILKALAQSEANRAGEPKIPELQGQQAEADLSALSGDQYVDARLKDQIGYYERTTRKLDRSAHWYRISIFLAGGAGTFLAALGVNVWVALTTAVVTALTARMEAEQQENSLIQYKQALAGLYGILNWWTSLSLPMKKEQANLDRLVNDTETTLASELAGWMQQMQTAIDRAQKPPGPDSASGSDQKTEPKATLPKPDTEKPGNTTAQPPQQPPAPVPSKPGGEEPPKENPKG